jgi:hypothetical protein
VTFASGEVHAASSSGPGVALSATATALPDPPTDVVATTMPSGQVSVSWTPPLLAVSEGVTGYAVTTYNDQSQKVGAVESAPSSPFTVTGLTEGTPYYFTVASVSGSGTGPAAPSYSVTPPTAAIPPEEMTAVSTAQYLLPNSDGSTWQPMDEANLRFSITPTADESVLLGANADLWTFDAGYNQDIGIEVIPEVGTPVLAGWKESGGFAGTFSPNAAFVETVYPMNAGMTYTVEIVWKSNRPAIGTTIAAGAGPIGSAFSPTRLTAMVLPAGQFQSVVSTQQYGLYWGGGGIGWTEMDASNLAVTFSPLADENVVLSANADLWTSVAGYNQDLGIFVSVDGGTPALVAWKESGGFAGTYSPNAAFVQAVYPLTAGETYVFSLWWKPNNQTECTSWSYCLYTGAGPLVSPPDCVDNGTCPYSPTRLTAYLLPVNAAPDQWQSVVSTSQYSLSGSDGVTWTEIDPTSLATQSIAIPGGGPAETVIVGGNADLWTADAGYNQDLGIEVSVDGGAPTLLAWKESGGFAGTFSPNAAFVQAVYTMEPGDSYVFSLWWKTNIAAPGGTIYAGAGPIGAYYSPTRLTVIPQL